MPSFHNTPGLDYSFFPLPTQEIFDATMMLFDATEVFFSFFKLLLHPRRPKHFYPRLGLDEPSHGLNEEPNWT